MGPETAFVLVAGPESESVKQAQRFLERLQEGDVRVAGVVANRVRLWPVPGDPPTVEAGSDDVAALARALERQEVEGFPAARAARAAVDAASRYAGIVRRDAEALSVLRQSAEQRGSFFRVVPEQRGDVHDLTGLERVATALSAEQRRDRDPESSDSGRFDGEPVGERREPASGQ
jgi:anion-transporting  ArsA/GET3 family ATPase